MKKQYTALILEGAAEYIGTMSDSDQGITKADIDAMEQGEFEAVKTKQLRGKIRELIVGKHRLTYFILDKFIYFVRGFTKKTNKTPPKEISYAEQILKLVQDQEK
jgi:phage-related protein